MSIRTHVVVVIFIASFAALAGCLKTVDRGLTEETVQGDITPGFPEGWLLYGPIDGQQAFDSHGGFDAAIKHGGNYSGSFFSLDVTKDDQVRLVQRIMATEYLGKRVRFSGYVKTNEINGWCGLWMRVDTWDKHDWAFDDMEDRELKGTTDWTYCEIVLDVPTDAATIYFGAHLFGRGQVWFDDGSFEIVGDDVKATDGTRMRGGYDRVRSIPETLEDEPLNLDFENIEFIWQYDG